MRLNLKRQRLGPGVSATKRTKDSGGTPTPPVVDDAILLEDGDFMLLENGDYILKEDA